MFTLHNKVAFPVYILSHILNRLGLLRKRGRSYWCWKPTSTVDLLCSGIISRPAGSPCPHGASGEVWGGRSSLCEAGSWNLNLWNQSLAQSGRCWDAWSSSVTIVFGAWCIMRGVHWEAQAVNSWLLLIFLWSRWIWSQRNPWKSIYCLTSSSQRLVWSLTEVRCRRSAASSMSPDLDRLGCRLKSSLAGARSSDHICSLPIRRRGALPNRCVNL